MALIKTITINIHIPDKAVEQDGAGETLSTAIDNMQLEESVRSLVEVKLFRNPITLSATVTVHRD